MVLQHVKHDIFRHAIGEIFDRHANQRHFRQAGIGHQRIDARTQVENDAQVWKCRKLAMARFPDRGVVDFGGIKRRIRQQPDSPVHADIVEPAFPSLGRPVFGPAMHDQRERSFVHQIFSPACRMAGNLSGRHRDAQKARALASGLLAGTGRSSVFRTDEVR
jgi:hypothetical protein